MYFGLYKVGNSIISVMVFNFMESVNVCVPIVLTCDSKVFGINSTRNADRG